MLFPHYPHQCGQPKLKDQANQAFVVYNMLFS